MDHAIASRDTFEFEYTRHITEADYVSLMLEPPGAGRRARVLLWTATILGILALFSLYTLALGVVLLLGALFAWTLPRLARSGHRMSYRDERHVHGPITYGVSNEGFWLHSAHLESRSPWSNLVVWRERDDVLYLGGSGMPAVYLPISQLQAAGVYQRVMELARQHGVENRAADDSARRLPQN